jgi:hypothetical protein
MQTMVFVNDVICQICEKCLCDLVNRFEVQIGAERFAYKGRELEGQVFALAPMQVIEVACVQHVLSTGMFLHLEQDNLRERPDNENTGACQGFGCADHRQYSIDDICADEGGDDDHCPFGEETNNDRAKYAPNDER